MIVKLGLKIIAGLGLLILTACGSLSPPQQGGLLSVLNESAPNMVPADEPILDVMASDGVQVDTQRVVIKTGGLDMTVETVSDSLSRINQLASELGGWVVNSSSMTNTDGVGTEYVTGYITIRVLAERFDEALTRIKAEAIAVDREAITGQDVTQEYVDLTSRLGNLQAAEQQLQTILESATTTDDTLKIYNELVRIRGDIETIQGRIQYYDESAAYSSITVNLQPRALAVNAVAVGEWNPGNTVQGAWNALLNVLQFLANALIVFIILILPLLLLIGLPLWFIRRWLVRQGGGKPLPKPASQPVPDAAE